MFIDRKDKMQTLDQEYQRQGASFVPVYGRRRTGKTTLLKEFCKGKPYVYFLAVEESEQENMKMFASVAAKSLNIPFLADMNSWESIFRVMFSSINETRKIIIVVDEFQYIGKDNPSFPSVLMRIWDMFLQEQNVMLVLCGSLINMMYDQVLNYNSPLYGRRTAQIRLGQIPFKYYSEFCPEFSETECMEHYSITGGVPKYIEIFSKKKDIFSAINVNLFNTDAFLYAEPEFLLQKEVGSGAVGSLLSILRVIASGNHRMSKIATAAGIKQTSLSRVLAMLEKLDLIKREVPITEEMPEKSKKGLYFIKDNFIEFWFKFVYPYRSFIESGQLEYIQEKLKANFVDNHLSFVYEEICRDKMFNLAVEKGWEINRVGRWWDKNTEIDVVAYNAMGDNMVFGECKYSVNPKGADVLYALKQKAMSVDWKNGSRKENYVIFSKSGYTDELKKIAETEGNIVLY